MTETDQTPAVVEPEGIRGEFSETEYRPYSAQTYEEWAEDGRTFQRIGRSIQWWAGDWMRFGEEHFGEKAFAFLDKADKTFANWATTCRKISPERRRQTLSYSHHAEVASLPPEKADEILDEAEWEGYTVAQTRERANQEKQREAEEEHGPSEMVVTRPCPHCEGTGRVVVEGDPEGSEAEESLVTLKPDDLGGDAA